MENVRDNPRAIREILHESESESDKVSIFSGDSNNYEPQENEDSDENNGTDGEQSVSDEETDDEPPSTDGWSKYSRQPDFVKHNFTAANGFKPPYPPPKEVKDFFMLFFTPELMHEFTKNTNEYAKEQIRKNTPLKERSIWRHWVDVTNEEIMAFFGVILNMGMNPKPEIQDYFTEEWTQKSPFYKDVFSRERFFQIFWMFHAGLLVRRRAPQVNTRGATMKNMVDYLDRKFREYYIPGRNICIDGSTIGFKGRVIFKCFNPKKPTKWGLRVYVLADSVTFYITCIEPYYGSEIT